MTNPILLLLTFNLDLKKLWAYIFWIEMCPCSRTVIARFPDFVNVNSVLTRRKSGYFAANEKSIFILEKFESPTDLNCKKKNTFKNNTSTSSENTQHFAFTHFHNLVVLKDQKKCTR